MSTRREFLHRGLGALAAGTLTGRVLGNPGFFATIRPASTHSTLRSNPFRPLPRRPQSVLVNGLPFEPWFTGDSFKNDAIPFHFITDWFDGGSPPEPEEHLDIVIVGGGLSGLATAYLLRDLRPVVFELRDRFGGNAMGETWNQIPFSLGSAYFIAPDKGSFLEQFYLDLGLDRVARISGPQDPVELGGEIRYDFWSGKNLPAEEQVAIQRYSEVVTYMAEKAYPEIPLPDDPEEIKRIHALDRRTFREDLEQQMGIPLTPLLAGAVQGYFYSAFGAAMEEISAASGWNFVAAEEYGRWVLPGGNAYLAMALWEVLLRTETSETSEKAQPRLRTRAQVIDVRPRGQLVQVSYFDESRTLRSLTARNVVLAGAKPICKRILFDLANWDEDRYDAITAIHTRPYLVANVLIEGPVKTDFYDCFLIGDSNFPMDGSAFERRSRVVDVLRGDYAKGPGGAQSVLTLYWPLPWPAARFTLLLEDPWQNYAEKLAPQVQNILELFDVNPSTVRQVRMSRWGHAMPLARPNLIADGIVDRIRRPLGTNIFFVNQDNWALPAVENSLLDAKWVADMIRERI